MIKLVNYHVGFGDFIYLEILCNGNANSFIFDCGSNGRAGQYQNYLHKCSDHSSFILSHFHDDHYNIIYDSDFRIKTLYLPKPTVTDGLIDFIAVACMYLICSKGNFETTSAWFIINIIEQINHHFCFDKLYYFADGETLWNTEHYAIRSISYKKSNQNDEVIKFISYFESRRRGIKKIIQALCEEYVLFSSQRLTSDWAASIGGIIKQLLIYRNLVGNIPSHIKKDILNLYDRVVNNASSVIGVFEDGTIRCLFLGDLDVKNQEAVYDSVGEVPVIKVAHHGTSNYNTQNLIKRFNPRLLLLTYGDNTGRSDNVIAPYFQKFYTNVIKKESDCYEI